MESQPPTATTSRVRHPSPPLGVVAIVFTVLFLAGLSPVTVFGGRPYFPGPWESSDTIVAFFQTRPTAVLICSTKPWWKLQRRTKKRGC